jgi:hypothetical protein
MQNGKTRRPYQPFRASASFVEQVFDRQSVVKFYRILAAEHGIVNLRVILRSELRSITAPVAMWVELRESETVRISARLSNTTRATI